MVPSGYLRVEGEKIFEIYDLMQKVILKYFENLKTFRNEFSAVGAVDDALQRGFTPLKRG